MIQGLRVRYIEDDSLVGPTVCEDLRLLGYEAEWRQNGEEGLADFQRGRDNPCDVLLLDLDLSHGGGKLQGEGVLKRLRDEGISLPVIILTADESYAGMLALLRRYGSGPKRLVFDYRLKTVQDPFAGTPDRPAPLRTPRPGAMGVPSERKLLALAIEHAWARHRAPKADIPPAMIGASQAILGLYETLRALAESRMKPPAPVLLVGESGTGKEVAAHLLHHLSSRRDKPFRPVNCGAFVETLMESELFGHAENAFTGAVFHPGILRDAKGGTVFLDEVGELAPALQVKLLRAIEYRKVRGVGELKETDVDVRYVAATNQQLLARIRDGRFRGELFNRLATFIVHIPPLRERREDIPPLLRSFLRDAASKSGDGLPIDDVDHKGIEALLSSPAYSFRAGNLRELKSLVQRGLLRCTITGDRTLAPDHFDWANRMGMAFFQDPPADAPTPEPAAVEDADALFARMIPLAERLGDRLLDGLDAHGPQAPKQATRRFQAVDLEYQLLKAVHRRQAREGMPQGAPTLEQCRRWFGWSSRQAFAAALHRHEVPEPEPDGGSQ